MKSVTMRDVALKAHVASSTVSRYINKSGYVDSETAKNISEAIKELNYQPPAKNNRSSYKKNLILLAVTDICNPFYSSLCQYIQGMLYEKGYTMTIFDTKNGYLELDAIKLAKDLKVRGIIMASLKDSEATKREIKSSNIPTVMLNAFGNFDCDCVHVDGSMATYIACQHLINLGHKHIVYAGGLQNTVIGNSRLEGYLQAMEENGLVPGPKDIMQMDLSQEAGYEIGRSIASMKPLPTAVCCANDIMALGILSALQERQIKIPEDISVTGVDDIIFAENYSPSLTTVSNDPHEFAQRGLNFLLSRINKTYSGAPRFRAIKHHLLIRISTAPPKM